MAFSDTMRDMLTKGMAASRDVMAKASSQAQTWGEMGVPMQAVTFGDCNFEMGGVPVKIGLLRLATNDPVAWSAARHVHSGNLGMADGSVQASTTSGDLIFVLRMS